MSEYDIDNVFAKIIRGEIPCEEIYQDEKILAFNDISKAAPTHVLIIPKGEYISFDDFVVKASAGDVSHFFSKVREIAKNLGSDETGYRLITNHGKDANQTVPHFHVHILAGKPLGGLLQDDNLNR